MSPRFWIWLVLAPALIRTHAEEYDGLNEVVGANQTLEQGFGARQSGMAVTFPSFQRDADAVANSPAAMNDVDDFTFTTGHSEKFGEAKYDNFALLFPFESNSSLGLGLSRYGISGIDSRPPDSDPLASQPPEVFSVADYLVVGAFARRWGGLDVGANLNLLYRQLDQDGLGIRGDAQAQYTWRERYRVGGLVKGLVPSSARWESGYAEYQAPELYLGGAARFPAPYFYGTLEAAWQSEGLFHTEAKSATGLNGGTVRKDPLKFLAASDLGLEFLFDFGMAMRFGLSEFSLASFIDVATFGIGYNWRRILGLDYSFSPHPGLLSTHRVSLQFTPSFPKFNGRNFRTRGQDAGKARAPEAEGGVPEPAHRAPLPAGGTPVQPENKILEPVTPPAQRGIPSQGSSAPGESPKSGASPEKPPDPIPGTPVAPSQNTPPPEEQEILDEEDEGQ